MNVTMEEANAYVQSKAEAIKTKATEAQFAENKAAGDSGIFIIPNSFTFFLSCGCCHPKLSLHALFPCSYRQLYLPELCEAYHFIEYSFLDFSQGDFLAGQSS